MQSSYLRASRTRNGRQSTLEPPILWRSPLQLRRSCTSFLEGGCSFGVVISAISPMIEEMAGSIGVDYEKYVKLYQSLYFQDQFTSEIKVLPT